MKKSPTTAKRTVDIVATLGDVSNTNTTIADMLRAGMNVVRINMCHGDHSEHHDQVLMARKNAKKLNLPIQIIVDLGGPKIRLGMIAKDTVLEPGSLVTITTRPCVGNHKEFSISYKKLPSEVKKGQMILISDGKRRLQVVSTNKKDTIICKVIAGGLITSRRGVNVPGAQLSVASITTKDKADIVFAQEHRADWIALSFVRSTKDIQQARTILRRSGFNAQIMSKIETTEAIADIENIVKLSDGIMVARGDLGVEIGYEQVPTQQKRIMKLCKKYGKPVIVATQILDSMEQSPVPTRAEVSDIYNAVLDGADGLMTSGESAVGHYPIEVIKVLKKVSSVALHHYE